jgi:hypothetical protein
MCIYFGSYALLFRYTHLHQLLVWYTNDTSYSGSVNFVGSLASELEGSRYTMGMLEYYVTSQPLDLQIYAWLTTFSS